MNCAKCKRKLGRLESGNMCRRCRAPRTTDATERLKAEQQQKKKKRWLYSSRCDCGNAVRLVGRTDKCDECLAKRRRIKEAIPDCPVCGEPPKVMCHEDASIWDAMAHCPRRCIGTSGMACISQPSSVARKQALTRWRLAVEEKRNELTGGLGELFEIPAPSKSEKMNQ